MELPVGISDVQIRWCLTGALLSFILIPAVTPKPTREWTAFLSTPLAPLREKQARVTVHPCHFRTAASTVQSFTELKLPSTVYKLGLLFHGAWWSVMPLTNPGRSWENSFYSQPTGTPTSSKNLWLNAGCWSTLPANFIQWVLHKWFSEGNTSCAGVWVCGLVKWGGGQQGDKGCGEGREEEKG